MKLLTFGCTYTHNCTPPQEEKVKRFNLNFKFQCWVGKLSHELPTLPVVVRFGVSSGNSYCRVYFAGFSQMATNNPIVHHHTVPHFLVLDLFLHRKRFCWKSFNGVDSLDIFTGKYFLTGRSQVRISWIKGVHLNVRMQMSQRRKSPSWEDILKWRSLRRPPKCLHADVP